GKPPTSKLRSQEVPAATTGPALRTHSSTSKTNTPELRPARNELSQTVTFGVITSAGGTERCKDRRGWRSSLDPPATAREALASPEVRSYLERRGDSYECRQSGRKSGESPQICWGNPGDCRQYHSGGCRQRPGKTCH